MESILSANYPFIERNQILTEEFFSHMIQYDALTIDDREDIMLNCSTQKRIYEFLTILKTKGPSAINTFIQACLCSKQKHIADELILSLHERNKSTSVDSKNEMSTLERDMLKNNRVSINRTLQLTDDFFDVIMEDNIITEYLKEKIKKAGDPRETKIAELLRFLPRRGPRAFKKFIEACVSSDQLDLAITLDKEYALELYHMCYKSNFKKFISKLYNVYVFLYKHVLLNKNSNSRCQDIAPSYCSTRCNKLYPYQETVFQTVCINCSEICLMQPRLLLCSCFRANCSVTERIKLNRCLLSKTLY